MHEHVSVSSTNTLSSKVANHMFANVSIWITMSDLFGFTEQYEFLEIIEKRTYVRHECLENKISMFHHSSLQNSHLEELPNLNSSYPLSFYT